MALGQDGGIVVFNTPGANAYAVAEHAITLMLAIARKIPQIDREMKLQETRIKSARACEYRATSAGTSEGG